MKVNILLVYGVLSVGFAEELPLFIKKCSLKDPDIEKCIATNGNLAIPELVKGSSYFGIPRATPLHISSVTLTGTDFTVSLSNVRLYGLENMRMKDVSYQPLNDWGGASLAAPYLNLTADYAIVSNDFFPRILETGRLRTDLSETIFRYVGIRDRLSKTGEDFVKVVNDDIGSQTKRIYYSYNDLRTSSIGNLPSFLNVHKRIVDERIRPGVRIILRNFITTILTNLVKKLPEENYFEE